MTDDEAFARAVVDRPGDDTPRLVYADWLDDHDQPARAAYLRAEREAVRTGDAAGLRDLAAGLDAVWVARVSRPPVGVCCPRLAGARAEQLVTPDEIDEAGTRLGVEVPDELRGLLLNYNLGSLWAEPLVFPGVRGCEPILVSGFVSLNLPILDEGRIDEDLTDRTWCVREHGAAFNELLFLAGGAQFQHFLVSAREADRGAVFLVEDLDEVPGDDGETDDPAAGAVVRVADSVAAFLGLLEPYTRSSDPPPSDVNV
ncbi:MAG: TIGR02996 domain-containing protein [Gemmataceae bacterium]|nr:TIGR02996 domain-containing protein [Gemmataceae bacterium]